MKSSKWVSREDRTRAANGKAEVLPALMREDADWKLDLWLELGHFQLAPGAPSRLAQMMYLLNKGGKSVPPFHEASHVRGRWRAPLLAEPDQTPHITMWHYGYGRLLRCGCAGSMRREGYGGCAGAVVLGHGRSAPLNTAVECSSSPQCRGSKATGRPPCAPGSGET